MSHILENLDILSEGFPENKYSIKIKSYIILTFQKLLAPLQCHFWLGNTQYFGFWRIHSIFTPPSLPSHLYLVNILLTCGMTEHIIYSWGNEGPSSVFRIKRIMIWGLWWWCDDQKNSCTVRLGFGFNSTVYRIVLQKMRLNWFEQKLMKTSTRSISKLFNEFVQFRVTGKRSNDDMPYRPGASWWNFKTFGANPYFLCMFWTLSQKRIALFMFIFYSG